MTYLTSNDRGPWDVFLWDACASGRDVRGVAGNPLLARLRMMTALLSMPAPAYGVVQRAQVDMSDAAPPSYVYGRVLLQMRRGPAGIERADE